ncbi:CCR4-NOT transcription complex subunit 3-like isoform X1 [Cucurbita moschata]|uniref:CCR4-NOT transcription complex subunit 3-like isoform X1 n=1 Tax=Cucurbita moschata TaxID=3662 RepID=A0A6J1EY06_CUCMO|nr:CCR4-NOT transcription complex subunit 3-like isoform X1 [Cucurbita moschata]
MGASRKLQGEIDRVLKKVQEGVDVFDSIWNKVYDTDNSNQKEKFEADLKKEIKKLQRYRDQIKTWIQSSEIKDKKVSASYEQALLDARKLIEREMERFKICEKETKTKAFSKEGLGQQPKTDPKEKAKSETRDWLNNVVSELESQIDNFEAEVEGLSVKKGKQRPPRLVHLETSITRHKAHIMKLELILRLLDNDELSPEQVNDVKDFLEDYVERNQEDFDEFSDVDELYSSLPLDKVESLEDLVAICPPSLVKGTPALNLKTSVATLATQVPVTGAPNLQQNTVIPDQVDDSTLPDGNTDTLLKNPPPKNSVLGSSAATSPTGNHATSASLNGAGHGSALSATSAILTGSSAVRAVLETTGASNSSPVNMPTSAKDEEIASFPGRKLSPSFSDSGLVRGGMGRAVITNQPPSTSSHTSGIVVPSTIILGSVPSTSEVTMRNIMGVEERAGNSGMVQSMVSPLSNRIVLPTAAKVSDGTTTVDPSNVSDAAAIGGRVFSPSVVPSMQWRPGSSFQNPNEGGQFRGRAEIAPDQREKFLQRLQQVQQQGHSTLLGMTLGGGNHKQFSSQQQSSLLQQFNSQNSSVTSQAGLGIGVQAPGVNAVTSGSLQQQPTSFQQSNQQALMTTGAKDSDVAHSKVEEEQQQQQQQQSLPEDTTDSASASASASASVLGKNLMNDDDLKGSYAVDTPAGVPASLTETASVSREDDLSPGQPLQPGQPSGSLGVIGRRSVSDLGAIGDSLGGSSMATGGMHDQFYNLQMLEAAYYKLPQPKDSERPRSYTPRHPAITPPSYPQVQAPIINNPAFWDRLGLETYGTDTLFFAFYYQPNTYQQYLAARELKKQSWRYHRKYQTWFQRHEEPKVATDEYEQGTYVYFDFHVNNDDLQHGWCQRIKTEFTFEYNYLEDELNI